MVVIGSLAGLLFSIGTVVLVHGPTLHGMSVIDSFSSSISNIPGFSAFVLGVFTLAALVVELAASRSVSFQGCPGCVSDGRRQLLLEAEHWIGRGKPSKALRIYDRILADCPKDATTLLNKGYVYDELGKYDDAISVYDSVIKSAPGNAKARYNKGLALLEKGMLTDAFECFREALRIDRNDLLSLRKICYILFSRKEYAKTVRFCNRILKLDKGNIDIILMKGKALEYGGKLKDALKCYEDALKLDPKDEWAFQCRHALLKAMGRGDDID